MTQEIKPTGQNKVDIDVHQFLHDIGKQKDRNVWELRHRRLFEIILFNELGIMERVDAFAKAHEDSQVLISEPDTGHLAIITRWNFRQENGCEFFDEMGIAYIGAAESIFKVNYDDGGPGLDGVNDWADYFLLWGGKPKIVRVYLPNTSLRNFLGNLGKSDEISFLLEVTQRETSRLSTEDKYFTYETFGEHQTWITQEYDNQRSETTHKLYRSLVEVFASPKVVRNTRRGLNIPILDKLYGGIVKRQREDMRKVSQVSDKIWRDAMRKSGQPIPDTSESELTDIKDYLEQQTLEEEDLWDEEMEMEMYGDDQYQSHSDCYYHEEYDGYTSAFDTSDYHSHVDG